MAHRLRIGDNAPEFTLRSVDGPVVSLSDFNGAPVVIVLLRSLN